MLAKFAARFLLTVFAAVIAAPQALAQQPRALTGYGIVVLHGKGGTPTTGIEGLTESLKAQGALVETPELPWSARRIYDATYDQAMDEIDVAVEKLKKAGAKKIAVVGHSLGANAAIGYAARRKGLTAVVALAPGHLPEAWALRARTSGAIATARKMIAAGVSKRTAEGEGLEKEGECIVPLVTAPSRWTPSPEQAV